MLAPLSSAVAAMIWLAPCQGATAGDGVAGCRLTLVSATVHKSDARPAGVRRARRSRAVPTPGTGSFRTPGTPPGPGYCWYYIDRSTGAPGFWDICRGR